MRPVRGFAAFAATRCHSLTLPQLNFKTGGGLLESAVGSIPTALRHRIKALSDDFSNFRVFAEMPLFW